MTAAGLSFAIMVAMVKIARADMAALDLVFWRGVTAIPLAYLLARKVPGGLRLHQGGVFAVRVIIGFGGMVCFFTAAGGLPVADFTLITKLQPVLIALTAPLLLGSDEHVEPFVWVLLIISLAGCALLLAPGLAVGSIAGLIAVAGAVMVAGAQLCIRALMRTNDARVVVFYFQAAASVLALAVILVSEGSFPALPSLSLWPYVLGIGISTTIGQLLMNLAYAHDRATVVAAASYTSPIWGLLIDVVVFALMPGWHVVAGGTVIVTAGLGLIFYNPRARSSQATSPRSRAPHAEDQEPRASASQRRPTTANAALERSYDDLS